MTRAAAFPRHVCHMNTVTTPSADATNHIVGSNFQVFLIPIPQVDLDDDLVCLFMLCVGVLTPDEQSVGANTCRFWRRAHVTKKAP